MSGGSTNMGWKLAAQGELRVSFLLIIPTLVAIIHVHRCLLQLGPTHNTIWWNYIPLVEKPAHYISAKELVLTSSDHCGVATVICSSSQKAAPSPM